MHRMDLLRQKAAVPLRSLALAAGGVALTVSSGAAASAAVPGPPVTSLSGTPAAVGDLSASDAWAVEGTNRVLRWNGTAWTQMTLPQYGKGSHLEAVDALSATDVWAAGFYATAASQGQALLERWNGTSWSRVPGPTTPGMFLQGVSGTSASDAWAVGNQVVASPPVFSVSVILHWNGTGWTRVPSPDPGGGTNVYLNAVTSLSPADAWAVGYYTTATGATRALTAHWTGTGWTVVPAPNPANGGFLDLTGVSAASASDIWAVGTYGNQKTLALHWNGTAWTQAATPSPGYTGNALSAVAAVSSALAWAVGSYQVFKPTGEIPTKTLLLQWNGTRWTRVTSPDPGAGVSTLNGVAAASASDAWAVGYYQPQPNGGPVPSTTLMMHWNGTAWTRS